MNKCLFMAILLTVLSASVLAQPTIPPAGQAVPTSNDVKSLNRQSSFVNYLQAVANDITNNNKGLQLQGTLASMVPKDSNMKFFRYSQLTLNGGAGSTGRITSLGGGYSYAIINERDSLAHYPYLEVRKSPDQLITHSLAVILGNCTDEYAEIHYLPTLRNQLDSLLTVKFNNKDTALLKAIAALPVVTQLPVNGNSPLDRTDSSFITRLQDTLQIWLQLPAATGQSDFKAYIANTAAMTSVLQVNSILNLLISYMVTGQYEHQLQTTLLSYAYLKVRPSLKYMGGDTTTVDFKEVIRLADSVLNGDPATKGLTVASIYNQYGALILKKAQQISRRGLLQPGINYTYTSTGGPRAVMVPSLQYFKGFSLSSTKNEPAELDFTLADSLASDTTVASQPLTRNIGVLKGNFDITLFTDPSGVSLLEAKLGPEYDHVYGVHYKNEKWDKYYFNATIQGRPTAKSPWFTISLKYDPSKGEFFGFLDLTFALQNGSTNSSSSSNSSAN